MRVLDIDLDFFVHGVARFRSRELGRLNREEFPPWSIDETMRFLGEHCGLGTGDESSPKLPGVALEYHADVFFVWRDAIEQGYLDVPFIVNHLDAHADLGLGDAGYHYLMTDLLFQPVQDRSHKRELEDHIHDGNFLSFAVACRWVSDLIYVYNEDGGGNDILHLHMEHYARAASNLQLKAVTAEALKGNAGYYGEPDASELEPLVPFTKLHWKDFQVEESFDFVCLTRSPDYTPPESDELYDEIRQRFIDEDAWQLG